MKQFFYFIFFFLLANNSVFAWENHAEMTSIVLNDWAKNDKNFSSYLNQSIPAESLQSFLQATQLTLPAKLNEIEKWLTTHEEGYRPRPETLVYDPKKMNCAIDLETCFKKAIRINLDVPLQLIVYDPKHSYSRQSLPLKEIIPPYLLTEDKETHFSSIAQGSLVTRADVIATGSLQPDFGFDIYLYENNPTSFGKLYGFGKQPLGIPNLPLSSQILFHMSAYHEGKMIRLLMPRIKENYPEARAYLYFNLSQFAAEKGHPFWAALFLGWGLHYIQDITQPYHSSLSLGLNNYSTIYALIQSALGNDKKLSQLKNIQANRHILFEHLAADLFDNKNEKSENYKKIILDGLKNKSKDKTLPVCDLSSFYIRNVMNTSMDKIAYPYVNLVRDTIPLKYTDNPDFQANNFYDYNKLFLNEMSDSQRLKFSQELATVLELFASHTRNCIAYLK